MNCLKCGMALNSDDKFCPECGTPVPVQQSQNYTQTQQSQNYTQTQQSQNYTQTQQPYGYYTSTPSSGFCPDCGTEIFASDLFCPNCKRNLREWSGDYPYESGGTKKSQTVMIIAIAALAILVAVAIGAVIYVIAGREDNKGDSPVYTQSANGDSGDVDPGSGSGKAEPTPVPDPPVFTSVSATSTRNYDIDESNNEIVYYYPSYAVDGDMYTAWSSDRNIELTPTITLSANKKQYVTGIKMTNGYCKSQRTYTKNRRITKARISYEGGEKIATFSTDNFGNMITIYLDEPVYTDYIAIKVLETYYGSWMDIAISEIEVF